MFVSDHLGQVLMSKTTPCGVQDSFFKAPQVPGKEIRTSIRACRPDRWQWQHGVSGPISCLLHGLDLSTSLLRGWGHWQPPPSPLIWSCEVEKIEWGVLLPLMLWLSRGLRLPLCPISVMDDSKCLLLISHCLHTGPWPAWQTLSRQDREAATRPQGPFPSKKHRILEISPVSQEVSHGAEPSAWGA